MHLKKAVILGSGALKIGEAGEFDYSGSQAIKAVREEGIKTIVINPNIATIQTSEKLADKIYFLPIEPYFVEEVIKRERPEGILLGFGGQTALNCGVALAQRDVFENYNVKILGTPIETIRNTEDRALFVSKMKEINLNVPRSIAAHSIKEAIEAASEISYPVIVRAAFTLGGQGSGIASNEQELLEIARKAFSYTKQVLIEEYLTDWKEIEYEVVRDRFDNCITVCNMENIDPMGIHTGESIVIAPSQTLINREYHKLRDLAIRVIRHLGVIGECNIQFALDPKSEDYRIIEVNARLSRSSALASKATGYPLAFIAAKLALGHSLIELNNSITKKTIACFEPALDYVAVKIPRWDLQKFRKVSKVIGSEMKSVGEVMAIGRKFEEALQKAIRMLDIGMKGLVCNDIGFNNLDKELRTPSDMRILAVAEALRQGYSLERINELSGIDPWFISKIRNIVSIEKELQKYDLENISKELLRAAKEHGFSDEQIALLLNTTELKVREKRTRDHILPVVKQIDTLAAEYPAKTNYLYVTYNGMADDVSFSNKGRAVIVLGSGTYRIGSSVEFDWCCVNTVLTLKELGYKTIMMNYNPETVSTDYDICDRLYFEELSFERILDIYEREKPFGVIISVGGQIPNNLAMKLYKVKVKIVGTSPLSIDKAENRYKFSKLLDKLGIFQPAWKELTSIKEAIKFARKVGYPVLVRPSYVLSGAAMSIAFNDSNLEEYLEKASRISKEHPVVISKFIENAKEIEIDAVASKGELIVWAISEHVENAGVHSGDATMVLPPQKTYLATIAKIEKIARKVAAALKISGPFNIQFIAKENDVKVIECNLRASRSFPFVSKVSKVNFIELATKAMLNKKQMPCIGSVLGIDHVGVKAPQFSFSRLRGADPVLGVEMASTGEVGCLSMNFHEAFLKALTSVGFRLPKRNILVSIGGEQNKYRFLDSAKKLKTLGFKIFATEHTAKFLEANRIKSKILYKIHERKQPNIFSYITQRKVELVINIPESPDRLVLEDEYIIRRAAIDFNIPLITNLQLARLFVDALIKRKDQAPEILSWNEYKVSGLDK